MMQRRTESVIAAIKRMLRLDERIIQALMPGGEHDRQHYIGGYLTDSGKSEAQEAYERDTDGWIVLD